jgi:hypothetical protein
MDILFYIFLYIVGNFFIKGALFSNWEINILAFNIYFPKKKKYLQGKISPIYLLDTGHLSRFTITKYEICYKEVDKWIHLIFWVFVPLINVKTYFYEYHECDDVLQIDKRKEEMLEDIGERELSEYYEAEMEIIKKRERKELELFKSKQDKIDKLNQIFNDNYED